MQIQPGSSQPRKSGDARRARQAAGLTEDAFKGGDAASPRGSILKSPWRPGTGRLWRDLLARQEDEPRS